jgi:HEAT repeat protein
MKLTGPSRWLWAALLAMLVGGALLLWPSVNVMHPSLDKLSAIEFSERWSHPEMLRIRDLGVKAVPSLRRVLREKDSPKTRSLLWVKGTWPGATNYFSHFPDWSKMAERRRAACQVLRMLGPAGRTAAPEIIEILKSKDPRDLNSAMMTLWAIGLDAEICDRLDSLLEEEVSDSARAQIVGALGMVKPPSARTLKALTAALAHSSPYVQDRAAEALGQLEVGSPEAVSALKHLQVSSTNQLVVVSSSAALWDLKKDSSLALPPVFQVLENQLTKDFPPVLGGGNGGQAVTAAEQLFTKAGDLFRSMELSESEKSRALDLLESCCQKSGRIFIRMLLLPGMMDLGFPREKCLEVCRTGLNQTEDYYRIQAARLLAQVAEKHSVEEINLDTLIGDRNVGVRIYAAKVHWLKNRQASAVVPVLMEALDRSKHQSYYYTEVQPVALNLLADIGAEAHEAAETLEKIRQDPNPAIVKLASEALVKIRR